MRTILLAFLCIFSIQANANMGVQLGLTSSQLSDSANTVYDNRTGFAGGGNMEWDLAGIFALQLEAMYAQMGAKQTTGTIETTTKLDYIMVPLLMKLKLNMVVLTPYAFVGPYLSFAVSKMRSTQTIGSTTATDTAITTIKTLDYGAQFGAGLEIPLGPLAAFINLRYILGFADINDVSTSIVTLKNKGLLIAGGVQFGF